MRSEGYSSCLVCVCVCVCLSLCLSAHAILTEWQYVQFNYYSRLAHVLNVAVLHAYTCIINV